jgi:hypothetical protein
MPPTPQTTPPPISQEKVNDLIAKSNLKTSSNGCYGEICTLKVPLPPVENLYKPFEGYFQKKYSAAASGMVNPNSSWSEKLIYGTLATAVSPLALVEGMGTGILNAPNSAARMGQNLAAAVQSSETSDRVTHSLQTVVDFAEGFTGLGGAVLVNPSQIKPKLVPKAGAAVLPLTPAQILRRKAMQAEPKITKDVSSTAKQTGGKQEGLEFRLKEEDSLARKLASEPGKPINDSLRYTTVYESNQLASGAEQTMAKLESLGYEKIAVKNSFEEGSRYMGINTTFKSPEGQIFELQFHTPESFNVKQNLTHTLYEEFRLPSTTAERRLELQQQMNQITDTITIPPEIRTKVPNHPK